MRQQQQQRTAAEATTSEIRTQKTKRSNFVCDEQTEVTGIERTVGVDKIWTDLGRYSFQHNDGSQSTKKLQNMNKNNC